ncbi:MAG: phenylalanine--tRNA ligase subunit beta, partial [Chloroflexi bacterium]|nr:phenylalanine--tRNA ligase subunit beta [Chloroflexota bacterium]
MKIPLSWLKEFIDFRLTPTELAEKLTMSGTEAEKVSTTGGDWDNVVVGQITAVNPHPNADRLSLPTVDTGTGEVSVVCGAPNLSVGDKIAFAFVGAKLIDGHSGERTELKTATIRGVASSGMVCSEKELGISDSHEGILVLPPEAPVGSPLADYLGDTLLDLDVTPNRPDCLCVIGIAREVAALTGQSLHPPEVNYEETESAIDGQISVEIADPDLCARYCATLITGVKIGESPAWMQQRLLACGMRPINNIVDVTNYVMLELGQPLHAFDYQKIRGKKIIVRRAREGEALISLDGVERKMTGDMLVIADEARAVAIAGIMGGANSEVTDESTSILLEAANFNPVSIHHTGSKLALPSEACLRFERGIRPELTVPAIRRATQLMVQVTGGKAAQGMVDVFPGRRDHQPIRLTTGKVAQILGVEFTAEQITGGRRVVESGIQLSEYYLVGLGGRGLWRENAVETARVLSAINPDYIRLRTLSVQPGLPMHEGIVDGSFELLDDEEMVDELRLMIEGLECESSFVSDHINNLLQEVEGKLPEDKDKMLAVIDRFKRLPEDERTNYR